jgi:hypothetical protein
LINIVPDNFRCKEIRRFANNEREGEGGRRFRLDNENAGAAALNIYFTTAGGRWPILERRARASRAVGGQSPAQAGWRVQSGLPRHRAGPAPASGFLGIAADPVCSAELAGNRGVAIQRILERIDMSAQLPLSWSSA